MLRKMVEEHDYVAALAIIDELDEMAKDDKINKVESFVHILLLHLIKEQAEKHTTKSWTRSIEMALRSIVKSNKRRSAGGYYLRPDELKATIEESFSGAVQDAAYEAFGGAYTATRLGEMIDADQLKQEALDKILTYKQ